MSVLCLSFHARYRCRHTGACCTSGWAIPVEPEQRARLEAAVNSGTLRLSDSRAESGAGPFEADRLADGSSILRASPSGACSCYDARARRCRIHAQLGHDALPVSCQHFPRVCLIDQDGTYVTLSHYCPTAARMLVGATGEPSATLREGDAATEKRHAPRSGLHVVEAPEAFAPMALEGLDARDALPPLLRPQMLADRESYRQWERQVLAVLDHEGPAEAALAGIIDATEAVREWAPGDGPLVAAVARAFDASGQRRAARATATLSAGALRFDALVRASVPQGLVAPPPPSSPLDGDAALVAARWPSFAPPIRRYLAAKTFASWVAYQGRGLRTVVASLLAALSVLRVEAVRHCAAAGRPLDEALLIESVRSADLLLVHLASREELARRLSAAEESSAMLFADLAPDRIRV